MKLYVPFVEDLAYREQLLSDPKTMAYNKGFDIELKGYDQETGCIDFPKNQWNKWYQNWINHDKSSFYAYIDHDDQYVGEVALHLNPNENAYMIHIIIQSDFRGRGYGRRGLILLIKHAFMEMKVNKLSDEFPVDRIYSIHLFKQLGFTSEVRGNLIRFWMTKEMFEHQGLLR